MKTSGSGKQGKLRVLIITNSGVFVESENYFEKVNIGNCSKCIFQSLCGY